MSIGCFTVYILHMVFIRHLLIPPNIITGDDAFERVFTIIVSAAGIFLLCSVIGVVYNTLKTSFSIL